MSGDVDDPIRSRLPTGMASTPLARTPVNTPPAAPSRSSAATSESRARSAGACQFLPAFWTIASVMSFTVNIVSDRHLARHVSTSGSRIQLTANDQVSGLLGGLYTQLCQNGSGEYHTNIHVEKEIPVQFTLNVSGPTNVTLEPRCDDQRCTGHCVNRRLEYRQCRCHDCAAADTVLPINIENLVVPVDQKVLAVLGCARGYSAGSDRIARAICWFAASCRTLVLSCSNPMRSEWCTGLFTNVKSMLSTRAFRTVIP